jgi:hypothetical protein
MVDFGVGEADRHCSVQRKEFPSSADEEVLPFVEAEVAVDQAAAQPVDDLTEFDSRRLSIDHNFEEVGGRPGCAAPNPGATTPRRSTAKRSGSRHSRQLPLRPAPCLQNDRTSRAPWQ